jgi:TaqI-like C-terminal specificity domain
MWSNSRRSREPHFTHCPESRFHTALRTCSGRHPSHYPATIAHLTKFRKRLDNIREVKNGIIKYYQLQWPREESIFRGAKIIAPQRSSCNTFAFNGEDWYASVDVYFLTQKDPEISLKYLLALLNSKLYFFWLYRRGKRKGEMLELYQKPLSEVPIKRIGVVANSMSRLGKVGRGERI